MCTATVYSPAKSGQLESLRIGDSLRFRLADVEQYEQRRIGARTERQRKHQS